MLFAHMTHWPQCKTMQRKRTLELAIVGIALALLVALAGLRASQRTAEYSTPSTYDTGANGYAALYDLLRAERVPVQRYELALGQLGAARNSALVGAGNGALDAMLDSPGDARVLDAWMRQGGMLAVFDGSISASARRTLHLPFLHQTKQVRVEITGCAMTSALRGATIDGTFGTGYAPACSADRATLLRHGRDAAALAYRRGRGWLVLFATPTPLDNLHISHPGNARLAYALFAGRSVLFDERLHGHDATRGFWQVLPQPMRIAVIVALIALLLATIGANLPFAPPYAAQPPDERDSGAYIASLGQMLARGAAAHEAVTRLSDVCERALGGRAASDERARMLLREMRTLQATQRPGPHEVLQAGRIFARVHKDYGC
jgi:hypothetical protein